MLSYVPQHTPSYTQGFARNAAESAYPNLWKGLAGLWLPALGPTGLTLHDPSGYKNHGTITGATWDTGLLDFDAAGESVDCPLAGMPSDYGRGSLLLWVTLNYSTNDTAGTPHNMATLGPADFANGGFKFFQNQQFNDIRIRHENGAGGVVGSDLNSTTVLFLDTLYLLSYTWDSVAGHRAYWLNGQIDTSDEVTTWTAGTGQVTSLRLCNKSNTPQNFDGQLHGAWLYDHAINQAVQQEIYKTPLAMVTRRAKVFPAAVAAPGGLSIPIAMHHYKQMMGA